MCQARRSQLYELFDLTKPSKFINSKQLIILILLYQGRSGFHQEDAPDGAAGEKGDRGEKGQGGIPGPAGMTGLPGRPGEKGKLGELGELVCDVKNNFVHWI